MGVAAKTALSFAWSVVPPQFVAGLVSLAKTRKFAVAAVAVLAAGVAVKFIRSQKDMAPADVLARDGGKGDWDKQGAAKMAKKGQGSNESFLMSQRMNQKGYGSEGSEGSTSPAGS